MGNVTAKIVDPKDGTPVHETLPSRHNRRHTRKLNDPPPPPPESYPDFVTSLVAELHEDFFRSVCSLLIHHSLFWQGRRQDPPLKFHKPEQLHQLIDFTLSKYGTKHLTLINYLAKIIHYSPRFAHPYYMFQLLSGLDPYSLMGDFVASVSPSIMSAYTDAPVYNVMEEVISKKLRELAGYPEDTGDCIFPPGSTIGICYGILLARHRKFPDTKKVGTLHLAPLVIFISQDAHYSYQKAAIYTGIGLNNVVLIKADEKGKMSVSHLRKAVIACLKAKKIPLMVGATSGTDSFGAFDPLHEIYKVCQQYGMWLHSDGALGGGIIFSEKRRSAHLKGIQLCDSFCGDLHKIGSATQTLTYFLTPHGSILTEALCLGRGGEDFSSYMELDWLEEDYFHSDRDTFEKYLDGIRRPDALKLFMMIKGKGLSGMEENVEDAYKKADFLLGELMKRMKEGQKFEPLLDEYECPVIAFYYVPNYLQKMDRTSALFKERMNLHTSFLLAELIKHGVMIITAQSLRSSPMFFKISTYNSCVTNQDLLYLLDQIDNYGSNLRIPVGYPGTEEVHGKPSGLHISEDHLGSEHSHHKRKRKNKKGEGSKQDIPQEGSEPEMKNEEEQQEQPAENDKPEPEQVDNQENVEVTPEPEVKMEEAVGEEVKEPEGVEENEPKNNEEEEEVTSKEEDENATTDNLPETEPEEAPAEPKADEEN